MNKLTRPTWLTMPRRRLAALLLAGTASLATGHPARAGQPNAQSPTSTKKPDNLLTKFDGPIYLVLYETFAETGARVLLEAHAKPFSPCGDLVVSLEQSAQKLELHIEGIRPVKEVAGHCQVNHGLPPTASVDLTNELGQRKLVVRWGEDADSYTIDITKQSLSIEAVGEPRVTNLQDDGQFLRVPQGAVWVQIVLSSPKLASKVEELVRALEAAGARLAPPTVGRYATRQNAWKILGTVQAKRAEGASFTAAIQYHYFLFEGDFETLVAVVKRWKRYYHPSSRSTPSMTIYIDGWAGGRYDTRP
jgi:hypothetical protein